MVWNGMLYVPDIDIPYKGYSIRPKRDMGGTPWLSSGNSIRRGYIAVNETGCSVLPGAMWVHSVIEAKVAIDLWTEAKGVPEIFWSLYREMQGFSEYEIV